MNRLLVTVVSNIQTFRFRSGPGRTPQQTRYGSASGPSTVLSPASLPGTAAAATAADRLPNSGGDQHLVAAEKAAVGVPADHIPI